MKNLTKNQKATHRRGAETQSFTLLIAPTALLTKQSFSLCLCASITAPALFYLRASCPNLR
jgi:hypothetical protein